mmetsp:Transcript_7197/g.26456  ORF Transcript_7197/g.26456 Transcript_7197/m.26456 type:complete len:192 (-) Transcript_7197:2372-2947(-)
MVESVDYRGQTLSIGDNVAMLPADSHSKPFIAKIDKILLRGDAKRKYKPKTDDYDVQVRWYYRPEEAIGGRKPFHGEDELFYSDHTDICPVGSINYKCEVHSLRTWMTLADEKRDDQYFCRFQYKASTGDFTPDRVPVYCTCELPFNPDFYMIECDLCSEWYHPECIGLSYEQIKKMKSFTCPNCSGDVVA